jgi:hypothetical protein
MSRDVNDNIIADIDRLPIIDYASLYPTVIRAYNVPTEVAEPSQRGEYSRSEHFRNSLDSIAARASQMPQHLREEEVDDDRIDAAAEFLGRINVQPYEGATVHSTPTQNSMQPVQNQPVQDQPVQDQVEDDMGWERMREQLDRRTSFRPSQQLARFLNRESSRQPTPSTATQQPAITSPEISPEIGDAAIPAPGPDHRPMGSSMNLRRLTPEEEKEVEEAQMREVAEEILTSMSEEDRQRERSQQLVTTQQQPSPVSARLAFPFPGLMVANQLPNPFGARDARTTWHRNADGSTTVCLTNGSTFTVPSWVGLHCNSSSSEERKEAENKEPESPSPQRLSEMERDVVLAHDRASSFLPNAGGLRVRELEREAVLAHGQASSFLQNVAPRGGLRLGELEREAVLAHGLPNFLERDQSPVASQSQFFPGVAGWHGPMAVGRASTGKSTMGSLIDRNPYTFDCDSEESKNEDTDDDAIIDVEGSSSDRLNNHTVAELVEMNEYGAALEKDMGSTLAIIVEKGIAPVSVLNALGCNYVVTCNLFIDAHENVGHLLVLKRWLAGHELTLLQWLADTDDGCSVRAYGIFVKDEWDEFLEIMLDMITSMIDWESIDADEDDTELDTKVRDNMQRIVEAHIEKCSKRNFEVSIEALMHIGERYPEMVMSCVLKIPDDVKILEFDDEIHFTREFAPELYDAMAVLPCARRRGDYAFKTLLPLLSDQNFDRLLLSIATGDNIIEIIKMDNMDALIDNASKRKTIVTGAIETFTQGLLVGAEAVVATELNGGAGSPDKFTDEQLRILFTPVFYSTKLYRAGLVSRGMCESAVKAALEQQMSGKVKYTQEQWQSILCALHGVELDEGILETIVEFGWRYKCGLATRDLDPLDLDPIVPWLLQVAPVSIIRNYRAFGYHLARGLLNSRYKDVLERSGVSRIQLLCHILSNAATGKLSPADVLEIEQEFKRCPDDLRLISTLSLHVEKLYGRLSWKQLQPMLTAIEKCPKFEDPNDSLALAVGALFEITPPESGKQRRAECLFRFINNLDISNYVTHVDANEPSFIWDYAKTVCYDLKAFGGETLRHEIANAESIPQNHMLRCLLVLICFCDNVDDSELLHIVCSGKDEKIEIPNTMKTVLQFLTKKLEDRLWIVDILNNRRQLPLMPPFAARVSVVHLEWPGVDTLKWTIGEMNRLSSTYQNRDTWKLSNGNGQDAGGVTRAFWHQLSLDIEEQAMDRVDGYLLPKPDIDLQMAKGVGQILAHSSYTERISLNIDLHPAIAVCAAWAGWLQEGIGCYPLSAIANLLGEEWFGIVAPATFQKYKAGATSGRLFRDEYTRRYGLLLPLIDVIVSTTIKKLSELQQQIRPLPKAFWQHFAGSRECNPDTLLPLLKISATSMDLDLELWKHCTLEAVRSMTIEQRRELWNFWFSTINPAFGSYAGHPSMMVVASTRGGAAISHTCNYMLELPHVAGDDPALLQLHIRDAIDRSLENHRRAAQMGWHFQIA